MRIVILFAVVALVIAVPLSHDAFAKKGDKPAKVDICHVTKTLDAPRSVLNIGHVITVSGNALEAHLAHGDSVRYRNLSERRRDRLEVLYGVNLGNANCIFRTR